MAMMIPSRAPSPELAAANAFQQIRTLIDREIDQCRQLEARNGHQFLNCVTLIRKSSYTQVRLRPDSLAMNLANSERLAKEISKLTGSPKNRLEKIWQLVIQKCETEYYGDYNDIIQACEKCPLSQSHIITHYAFESLYS